MRIGTKFLIFFIILFSINVVFYYISEDYRFFLKKIKNKDEVVYLEEKGMSDDILPIVEENITKTPEENIASISTLSNQEDTKIEKKQEIILWKNYREIIDIFSHYDFKQIELNTNLFDVTDEYPDSYYEYYSSNLTLYIFPTKSYQEIYDIFHLLEGELPFLINEVNNFWSHSFYINLKEDIDDNFIRMVIENKWVVFGLKIKKDDYNDVKQKILQIQ